MEAFFLPAHNGSRFCVFYPAQAPSRGNILFAPPFAEEMNKSRRMVALQARAFAQKGYAVLVLDLMGTGDSSGDFSEARWETWREDLALGASWLAARETGPLIVWGMRTGALLALDSTQKNILNPQQILLWQPVLSGETFMTQFLRLRLAGDMLSGNKSEGGVQALRAELKQGQSVEVAGYDLAPALAEAIDSLHMERLDPALPVHWLEIVAEVGRSPPPAAQRVMESWRRLNVDLYLDIVPCEAFWTTQEITVCLSLLHASQSQLVGRA